MYSKLLNELKRINALSVTATQTTPTRNTSTAINSEKNNKEEMLVMEVDAGEGGNHQPPAKNAPPMEQKLCIAYMYYNAQKF
jgi:hypothetical protein